MRAAAIPSIDLLQIQRERADFDRPFFLRVATVLQSPMKSLEKRQQRRF
jgi:hypothetical protein